MNYIKWKLRENLLKFNSEWKHGLCHQSQVTFVPFFWINYRKWREILLKFRRKHGLCQNNVINKLSLP